MARFSLHRHVLASLIFGFVFGLRLITLVRLLDTPYGRPVTADMKFYADWARRITEGQWTDFHAFYGQPLYAYLLAAFFWVGGFQLFWIGLVQCLLDAAIAVLIFRIAMLVFAGSSSRSILIGLLAAIGWAFYEPAAAYCGLLIPTSFVVAIWWLVVWWILQRSAAARWPEWFSLAFLTGVVAMISAATLFLFALLVAAVFLHRCHGALLAATVGLVLGTAPAWMHNSFVARDPVFISAHGGLNFWIGNNPEANGYPKIPSGLPSEQAALLQASIDAAEMNAGHPLPRSAVSKYWSKKALNYIVANPAEWVALLGLKIKNFWNNFRYDDLSSMTAMRDAGIILPGIQFGLLAALGLPGAFFALRDARARWIVAVVGLQMIALLPVFVNERYRLPAAPGLLLLSAFFVTELWTRLHRRRWGPIATAGACLIISTVFVSMGPTDPALLSLDNYKTGQRQLIANDFGRAEKRLRLAAAAAVPPAEVAAMVARLFALSAGEKWNLGQRDAALMTIAAASRIEPADEKVRQVHDAIDAESLRP